MMGSQYPKARRAASQERSLECLQTLRSLRGLGYGRRNIHKIWRRNGLFPATLSVRWHDVLRGCDAAVDFDFLHHPGLATHPHRHHCLAALRADKPGRGLKRQLPT
jgi:hypothetical protein